MFLLLDKDSKNVIDILSDKMPSDGYPMVHEIKAFLKEKYPDQDTAISACTEISE